MQLDASQTPGQALDFRPHRIPPSAVRAYDIRGMVGREIHRPGAYALGLSYAAAAREARVGRIGVGRDGRLSSATLEQALVWGLIDGGLYVERFGLGPTPMLGFAARRRGLEGAIMVTASHNPPGENGFKIMMGHERLYGARLRMLVQRRGGQRRCGWARRIEILDDYVDELVRAADGLSPMKIAWDCGHGATGPVVELLSARIPGEHLLLNTRVDGRFPAHHPDPAVARNLAQLARTVLAHRCDIGVAFDGDGDRLGVVDSRGRIVWADQLLLLLARDLLVRRPGAAVVADVKCSQVLFNGVEQAGGRISLSPSGYVLVREAMQRENAVLAGELSGHIFFGEAWGGVDDALYAAIRTFHAVSRLPGGLAAFYDSLPPTFATPELRLPCPEARKADVVREVAARLAAEGASFDPGLGLRVERPGGWWLLRASGTEPKLTCRCEASRPEGLEQLRGELRDQLALSGIFTEL